MSPSQSASRILPARPSLDSIRKQAKKLVREVAADNADAIARAQTHLSSWAPPLALRDAQFVLAREYGFDGWRDLREEVLKRIGAGLEWAASEAQRAIHDNDRERLKTLLAEHPGLRAWRDVEGLPLLQATTPYAMDVTDPEREATFCRPDCAALLIDAGALVTPSVWEALIRSGAAGMMALLLEKRVLSRSLAVLAALGDLPGVRACLDETEGRDLDAVNWAFMSACRFKREAVAAALLERCVVLDPHFGAEIDRWGDRGAFVADMIANCPSMYGSTAPWSAFVMRQLRDAMHTDDLPAFAGWLESQAWVLDDSHLALQVEILEQAASANREAFIRGLLDHDPAVLRSSEPPPSKALIYAFDYRNAHLIPLLTRIWPLPDDLPHAAGVGDLDRVKRWFDDRGQPALGDLSRHHPANYLAVSDDLRWGAVTVPNVLDVALAWAVLNKRFEVAEFLLAHGADINTNWSTHEPASILHECAVNGHFEGARFLVAHGVDLTIRDHRWDATAAGWARYAAKDEAMANFLIEAEEQRRLG
jgi:hypothetical protein